MTSDFNIIAALSTLRANNPDAFDRIFSEAITTNNVTAVEQLLKLGANIDGPGRDGNTPLMLAINFGATDVARLFVDRGANLNIQNKHRETALMLAVGSRNTDVVRLLVDRGANRDVRDDYGNSPMLVAAYNGDRVIIDLLKKPPTGEVACERPTATTIAAIKLALGLK